jgi:hypothetical protein
MRASFGTVNEAWRDIKVAAVTPEDMDIMNRYIYRYIYTYICLYIYIYIGVHVYI